MIFLHNHPSGDPAPSQEDRLLTERLASVGQLLGIAVLDHLIVGDNRYVSFADQGWLSERSGPLPAGTALPAPRRPGRRSQAARKRRAAGKPDA